MITISVDRWRKTRELVDDIHGPSDDYTPKTLSTLGTCKEAGGGGSSPLANIRRPTVSAAASDNAGLTPANSLLMLSAL